MATYDLSHTTIYRYSGQISMCQNQLRLTPRSDTFQSVLKHRLEITPKPTKILKSFDFFQNQVSYFELSQPHETLVVTSLAHVKMKRPPFALERGPSWQDVATQIQLDRSRQGIERFQYSLSSPHVPHCQDAHDIATSIFAPGRGILEASLDLNRLIHQQFRYDPNATTINTPLADVFRVRRGVCQDLSHAMLACFRSIGLSARYVSGYLRTYPPKDPQALVGADASHAWVSVYAGDLGWIDLDPTNDLLVSNEHITLAWGRDFRDVTPINGLYVGAEQQSLDVAVQVKPID